MRIAIKLVKEQKAVTATSVLTVGFCIVSYFIPEMKYGLYGALASLLGAGFHSYRKHHTSSASSPSPNSQTPTITIDIDTPKPIIDKPEPRPELIQTIPIENAPKPENVPMTIQNPKPMVFSQGKFVHKEPVFHSFQQGEFIHKALPPIQEKKVSFSESTDFDEKKRKVLTVSDKRAEMQKKAREVLEYVHAQTLVELSQSVDDLDDDEKRNNRKNRRKKKKRGH